jgi:hypothetical protein
MDVNFDALRQFFLSLSESQTSILLDRQPFVESLGDIEISVSKVGPIRYFRRQPNHPSHFQMVCSAEESKWVVQLIDSLIDSSVPCHQYLTQYPEDAVLVLSKGEYSDEVLTLK